MSSPRDSPVASAPSQASIWSRSSSSSDSEGIQAHHLSRREVEALALTPPPIRQPRLQILSDDEDEAEDEDEERMELEEDDGLLDRRTRRQVVMFEFMEAHDRLDLVRIAATIVRCEIECKSSRLKRF